MSTIDNDNVNAEKRNAVNKQDKLNILKKYEKM